jgi:hypothetical protein
VHRAALCQRAKTDVLRNLCGVPVDSEEVCTPRLPARLWAWEPVDVRHTLPAGSGRSSGHSPCLSRPTGRKPAARLLGRPGPGPGAQPGITAARAPLRRLAGRSTSLGDACQRTLIVGLSWDEGPWPVSEWVRVFTNGARPTPETVMEMRKISLLIVPFVVVASSALPMGPRTPPVMSK